MNIKNKACVIMALLTALSFLSCAKSDSVNTSQTLPVLAPLGHDSAQEELLPPEDPEIVSSLAEKYFLDIEQLSWIREFPVEYVMIHFCSDVVNNRTYPYGMEAIRRTFIQNEVSINYIIARNGDIQCWIPEQRAAWHAGKGTYGGDEKYTNAMNKYSIGIELVAIGSKSDMSQYLSSSAYNSISSNLIGFTDAQYEALSLLLKDIIQRWSIPADREHIIGHSEYSPHKSDPGQLFDWNRVINSLS